MSEVGLYSLSVWCQSLISEYTRLSISLRYHMIHSSSLFLWQQWVPISHYHGPRLIQQPPNKPPWIWAYSPHPISIGPLHASLFSIRLLVQSFLCLLPAHTLAMTLICHRSHSGPQKPSSPVLMLSILPTAHCLPVLWSQVWWTLLVLTNRTQVTSTNIIFAKSTQMAISNFKGGQENITLPYARKAKAGNTWWTVLLTSWLICQMNWPLHALLHPTSRTYFRLLPHLLTTAPGSSFS